MTRRPNRALLVAALAAGFLTAHGTRAAPSFALEVRAGTLVPRQILDGANLHAALAGRYRLTGPLWLHGEVALDRTTVSGLTADLATTAGAVRLRADQSQWTVPMLVGVALRQGAHARPRLGATLAGGLAWSAATLRSSVVTGEGKTTISGSYFEPTVLARVDAAYPLRKGEALVGIGWREVFGGGDDRPTGDVRSAGLILEVGWRVLF